MARIGVLASTESWYLADLQRAAAGLPETSIHPLSFVDLQVALSGSPASVELSCQELAREPNPQRREPIDCLRELDAIIVRTMPLGSLEQVIFRMDCLQVAEAEGSVVVNSPRSLEIAIDKWLTLHRLSQALIPVPATVACQTRDAAFDAFDRLGGDVLVKPLFGGEGRGIIRVQDRDMAWRTFSTLQQLGQVFYVQQFLDNFGYDVRILMIGEKVYSIKRFAPHGAWRTNLAQGSVAQPHTASDLELDLARRAAVATGGTILGIDLLPLKNGDTVVLEVNAVPGWKGLAAALNIDIATEVLRHVNQMAAKTQRAI